MLCDNVSTGAFQYRINTIGGTTANVARRSDPEKVRCPTSATTVSAHTHPAEIVAFMRQRHRIPAIRQEMCVRAFGVRATKAPRRNDADRRGRSGSLYRPGFRENRLSRHALLQQQFGRLYTWIGVEPLDKDVVEKDIRHRDQRHAQSSPIVRGVID